MHDDVAELKSWRLNVVEPVIDKVNTLWDERLFDKGVKWVILGISSATFMLLLVIIGWGLNHVRFHVEPEEQSIHTHATIPELTR